MENLLEVNNIHTYIGQYHILQGVSFTARKGEVTVLLGRNGAGKTTTLRSIMGLNPSRTGTITFKGENIQGLETFQIANRGIGYVPENQGLFSGLTVEENLKVAMKRQDDRTQKKLETVLRLFPDLKKYWKKESGHLSGGQKQMLSIARSYLNDNELLLIDEPSKGLAPIIVEKVMNFIDEMKEETTIVLVEQNFFMASSIGDRFSIIDDGKTVASGSMKDLIGDEFMKRKYLGIA